MYIERYLINKKWILTNESVSKAIIEKSDENPSLNLDLKHFPNENVKDIVQCTLPEGEYDINGSTIVTHRTNLMTLYEDINQYFDEFQQ